MGTSYATPYIFFNVKQGSETSYIICGSACIVGDNEWMHISKRCNIMERLTDKSTPVDEVSVYISSVELEHDIYVGTGLDGNN